MSAEQTRSFLLFRLIGVFLLFSAIIAGMAAALTVEIEPQQVAPGGEVVVSVTGVPDNVPLTIAFQAQFPVTAGEDFSFEIHDLVVPLNLTNRSLSIRMENTVYNRISFSEYEPGHPEINHTVIFAGPSVGGVFERSMSFADSTHPDESSEIRDIALAGNASGAAQTVVATYMIKAQKASGATDFQMPFTISGVDAATVKVSVSVNNQAVFSDTVRVDSPVERAMTVRVLSVPAGAAVSVDGVYAGQTPLFTEVFSGLRSIRIEKTGFYPVTKQVLVGNTPGNVIIVSAELYPIPLGPSAPASPGSGSPGVLIPVQPYIPVLVGGGTYTPGIIITPNPPSYPGGMVIVNPNAIVQPAIPIPFL